MSMLKAKRCMVILMSLAFIVGLAAVPSLAGKKQEIAGKMTMDYSERERIEVGDTEGHVMSIAASQGTNACTSEHSFMDGAQAMNMSFGDLVQGNGPHQGYVKFTLGDEVVFCRWEGVVTTTVPEEGDPIMSFQGTFSYIKGTGQFENIQGRGTYKGAFTSKTRYVTEWEGEYSIAK